MQAYRLPVDWHAATQPLKLCCPCRRLPAEVQSNLVHTLAESDAAVVFSERARLELDTAIGYLPAQSNTLQAGSIHVVPHGAATTRAFPNKDEKKVLLGLKGKSVLLTLGYQGPDKVRG